MNRVGELGQGESVWLGWLLYAALSAFAPLADARGDTARAAAWRAHAAALQAALEREAWDGDWYRRAWFDDGTPLGSATDDGVPDRFDLRSPGRRSRARPTRSVRGAPWRRSNAS